MSDHPILQELRALYKQLYGKDMPRAEAPGRCPRCGKPWDDHKNGICPK